MRHLVSLCWGRGWSALDCFSFPPAPHPLRNATLNISAMRSSFCQLACLLSEVPPWRKHRCAGMQLLLPGVGSSLGQRSDLLASRRGSALGCAAPEVPVLDAASQGCPGGMFVPHGSCCWCSEREKRCFFSLVWVHQWCL